MEVSKPGLCEGCEENEASNRCIDCSLNFCSSCNKPHMSVPATREHKVITLNEYKQPTPVICESHSNTENFTFYCDTCNLPVCCDCFITKCCTPEHRHKDTYDNLDEYTTRLNSMIATLKMEDRKVRKCITDQKQYTDILKQILQDEKEKIAKKVEEIIQKARNEEKRLVGQLEKEYNMRIQDAEKQLTKWETKHKSISHTYNYLETMVHNGNHSQLTKIGQESEHYVEDLIVKETKPEEFSLIRFKPSGNITELGMLGLLSSLDNDYKEAQNKVVMKSKLKTKTKKGILCMGPVLKISPDKQLEFQHTSHIELTNNTFGHIAFKVKSTSSTMFAVQPNCGILSPGEISKLKVTLVKDHKYKLESEKLSVDYVPIQNPAAFISSKQEINSLFSLLPPSSVKKHKLTCNHYNYTTRQPFCTSYKFII